MLAAYGFYNGILFVESERKYGDIVFHTHGCGGGVHCFYAVIDYIYILYMLVFLAFGIEHGVAVCI